MEEVYVLLSVIQKRAKQLKKEKSLKWHQARDEAAKEFGFTNFKNFENVSDANTKQYKLAIEILLKKLSQENDLQKKLNLATYFIQNHKPSFHFLFAIIKQFENSPEVVDTICKKANLIKNEIESFLLKDFLTEEGRDEINSAAPFFIAKKIHISNLSYELSNNSNVNNVSLCVDGEYKLIVKFELELDENDPLSRDERFDDREFVGSFDIKIDEMKKIEFVDLSISYDHSLSRNGFTEEEIEEYYTHYPDERGKFDDILNLNDSNFEEVKRLLSNNEPLTGDTLEVALDLVNVDGDDEQSQFVKNIGVKMKAGIPLDDYEYHILADVLMLHAQLSS